MHIQCVINSKSEYRNTKRFDRLTALSNVEGQIQISNAQMIKKPRSLDKPGFPLRSNKLREMRSPWWFKQFV
jgi:hypothetical protein